MAKKVIVLAVCCSIALGDAARVVLLALLQVQVLASIELPVSPAESSIPEESPTESSNSGDSSKKPETDSFALLRKGQKRKRCDAQQATFAGCHAIQIMTPMVGGSIANLNDEYVFRNGCGAHLRC